MKIEITSVDSVIIYFKNEISKQNSLKVKSAYNILKKQNNKRLIEIVPSYSSIFIIYDIFYYTSDEIIKYLNSLLKNLSLLEQNNKNIIYIDAYYGKDVGIDLQRVAKISKLSIDEIIKLHSKKVYDIYAIGFLPGFAYMGSVDDKISIPRLEEPRKNVLKGSIAIANNQTTIYPSNSPGGWNIIAKTTFNLFDKSLKELSPLNIQTKVKFNQISKDKFLAQGGII